MSPDCICGHDGGRHHEEPPYRCHECDCGAYEMVPVEARVIDLMVALKASLRRHNSETAESEETT